MEVWISKLTAVLCSALVLTASADIAFAGPKKTPRLKVTKLPRVALPQSKPPSVVPAPVVTFAVERAVTVKVAVPAASPTVATLPASVQKNFLTGPQVLAAYMPWWRSELRYQVFDEAQLDVIEQTFKETDQALFELDEQGNWVKPRSAEWNYEFLFSKILTTNTWRTKAFNDGQLKTLFGQRARFDDVFTRLNYQAFLLVNNRAPKPNAPEEEGKLARHIKYKLGKRDGRKMNLEVEDYVYGNMPAKLQTPTPSYGPRTISARRTPEQVWEEVTQFMREHDGNIPLQGASDDYERKLRRTWDNMYYRKHASNDPFVVRLTKLHKENVREKTTDKTPQEVLEGTLRFIQEHNGKMPSADSTDPVKKSLRQAGDYIWLQHKNDTPEELAQLDEYTRQLVELFKGNVKEIATPKTPQEVLEGTLLFMREHNGKMPSKYNTDPVEKSLRQAGNGIWLQHKNDMPQELAQLDEYTRKLVELFKENVREKATDKTPQEVWEDTLRFMREHNGKMPSADSTDPVEKSLRWAGNRIWQQHKNNTPQELAQLDEYTRQLVELFRKNVRSSTKKDKE